MRHFDAIVVGAGAMGSAAAWWLSRRGRTVLLLERFECGHERGSSHGSSRIFRLAYPDPYYVRLAMQALPLWRQLEDESGRELLTLSGSLDHGDPSITREIASALSACGVDHQMLEAEEAAERWSGMRFGGPALFHRQGGRINADAGVTTLQDQAARWGAEVRFGEGLIDLAVESDHVAVRTPLDTYCAPAAIIACGAWTPAILDGVVPLPRLRVTREQPAHFAPLDDAWWPSFIHHGRVDGAGWPVPLARYGLEAPGEGVKIGEHISGPEVDPDRRDFRPDHALLERLSRYVQEWLPGLDPTPKSVKTCLYTVSPTHDFIIDRTGPLVVCSACSGHGFKFTPAIGKLVADLAVHETDVPSRFRLPAFGGHA